MIIKFFQTIAKYKKLLVIVSLVLTTFMAWSAKQKLFDDQNSLIIDSTVEPFMSRGSGTYDFFKKMRTIFGSEEVLVVSLQPQNDAEIDLNFFLLTDKLSREIEDNLSGVKSVASLTTTPRVDGACSGDTFFHLESVGSTCVSVLDDYFGQQECINNKEKYLQALEEEEDVNGLDDALEEDEDEDIDISSSDEDSYGEAEEEEETASVEEELVCTASILDKSLTELNSETEGKINSIFEEIKAHKLIHRDLISPDFKTTALVIEFKLSTIPSSPIIQEKLVSILDNYRNDQIKISFSGQSRDEYTASKTLTSDITKILPFSLLLMLISLYISFKTFRGTFIPLVVVIVGMLWMFGIFALTGFTMNMVTMVLPPLLICVGSAYIIHFINQYYLDIAANPGASPFEITQQTIKHITVPLTVTALTTLAGFAALTVSPIPAVKEMGLFACIGIASVIFFTLTLVPAILSFMKIPKLKTFEKKTLLDKILNKMSEVIGKHSKKFIIFWVFIGILAVGGVLQVRVDSESKNFAKDSEIEMDKAFIQDNLAGTSTLRLVFSGKNTPSDLQTAETIYGIIKLKDWLIQKEGTNKISELNLNIDKIYTAVEYIDIYRNGLDNLTDKEVVTFFKDSKKRKFPKYLSDSKKLMQMNIRMKMGGTTALLHLKDLLSKKIPEVLPKLDIRFTGSGILSSESADNIAKGQVNSVILALAIIFVIMSIMFFSFKMGIIALYPNIIAISVYFGTLGWLDIPIGVTISVIASIALGIGVDDTIHFLNHNNVYVNKLRNEKQASMRTLREMGKPMVFTTVSLSLGFIIFYIAEMDSQVMFGVLTAYTLMVCLVTDTTFTPSIMVNTKLVTAWSYLGLNFKKQLSEEVGLFAGMTLREIKLATLMSYTQNLKKEQLLFKEGDIGHELFVILEGSIDIYLDEEFHGQRTHLAQLPKGASFGEMGLFRHSKRAASVRAVEKCKLLVLNEQVLVRLQKRYPKIATKLFLNLAINLGDTIIRTDKKFSEIKKKEIAKSPEQKPEQEVDLTDVVDAIIEDGVVTFEEQRQLNELIYADHEVSPEEQKQIDRLNKLVEEGKVTKEDQIFIGIFQHLTDKQKKWIYNEFEVMKVPKGARVFSQGDYGNYMLVVLKGMFNVEKEIEEEKGIVGTFFEGDVIGAISTICENNIRSSGVYAIEESEAIFMSMERLRRMRSEKLKLAAQLYYNIVCMLSDRLESINKKMYGGD